MESAAQPAPERPYVPRPWGHIIWARVWPYLAFSVAIVVLWLVAFSLGRVVPASIRPQIDIYTLPILEEFIVGLYLGTLFTHTPFLDLLAAAPYLLHMVFPFAMLAYLFWKLRWHNTPGATPIAFLAALGTTNLLAVVTQYVFPSAPPWYTEYHGFHAANYTMHGDPGGLARVDAYWNISLFTHMYDTGPIVFGSFPSLHAAWPMLFFSFQLTPLGKAVSIGHIALIVWAALYLHHHYVVDILGAALYVAYGRWLARLVWLAVRPRVMTPSHAWRTSWRAHLGFVCSLTCSRTLLYGTQYVLSTAVFKLTMFSREIVDGIEAVAARLCGDHRARAYRAPSPVTRPRSESV